MVFGHSRIFSIARRSPAALGGQETSQQKDTMVESQPSEIPDIIRHAGTAPQLVEVRSDLARFAADVFATVGGELHVVGHIIGSDRVTGSSPWGHGSDETVAISVILRIASQLIAQVCNSQRLGRFLLCVAFAFPFAADRHVSRSARCAWRCATFGESAAWLSIPVARRASGSD